MRLIIILLMIMSAETYAHKSSDSYLYIHETEQGARVQWEVAVRDFENVLLLDQNGNGEISWGEIISLEEALYDYARDKLALTSGKSSCNIKPTPMQINYHSDGAYLVLNFESPCNTTRSLDIQYDLFFDIDPQHRGFLNIQDSKGQASYVFAPSDRVFRYDKEAKSSWKSFNSFLLQGIWHIWIGFDHILFLVSLLLPIVLIWQEEKWQAVNAFKPVVLDSVKVITAFTLAHSLTLCFVILTDLSLPVNLVEIIIALSVIIVAVNNLLPKWRNFRWQLGFGFGLIHGLGFANVLAELQLDQANLFSSLLGFNIGVEIGQLVIVAAILPFAFLIRRSWFYQKLVFQFGSFSIICIGLFWVVERSL